MNFIYINKLLAIFLSVMLMCSFVIQAQDEVSVGLSMDAEIDKDIDELTQAQILETIERVLTNYTKLGNMIDPKSGLVSPSSKAHFKKLFTPNAKLYQDYLKKIPKGKELVNLDDYIQTVSNYLSVRGVEFIIEETELVKMEPDITGHFYSVEILVTKLMGNCINKKNKEENIINGRRIELKFSFDISINNLYHATIAGIESDSRSSMIDVNLEIIKSFVFKKSSEVKLC